MTQYNSEPTPDDPDLLPPARRRRYQRLLAPPDANERAIFVDTVAQRVSPSFDFYLFSLLSAAIFSAGLLLDTPPLLLLGALLAPLMAPVIGLALGTVTGSARFFFRSLVGILIASTLVFGVGILAGYASILLPPLGLELAHMQAHLSWINFLVLAVGAVATAGTMVHSEHSAVLPSVALAYELFLPLVAAGIGLGSGVTGLWPDGAVVFAIHLAWVAMLGALSLAILGFRPLTLFGYTLGGVVALLGVILLIGMTGAGVILSNQVVLPTHVPTGTMTITITTTQTYSSLPETATRTPARSPTPTQTPTQTHTLSPLPSLTPSSTPTPVLALIQAATGGGAIVRAEPNFQAAVVAVLINGTLVQLLPEAAVVDKGGATWLHVRLLDAREAWILQNLLVIATPAPNW